MLENRGRSNGRRAVSLAGTVGGGLGASLSHCPMQAGIMTAMTWKNTETKRWSP